MQMFWDDVQTWCRVNRFVVVDVGMCPIFPAPMGCAISRSLSQCCWRCFACCCGHSLWLPTLTTALLVPMAMFIPCLISCCRSRCQLFCHARSCRCTSCCQSSCCCCLFRHSIWCCCCCRCSSSFLSVWCLESTPSIRCTVMYWIHSILSMFVDVRPGANLPALAHLDVPVVVDVGFPVHFPWCAEFLDAWASWRPSSDLIALSDVRGFVGESSWWRCRCDVSTQVTKEKSKIWCRSKWMWELLVSYCAIIALMLRNLSL